MPRGTPLVYRRSETIARTLADADREHILETLEQTGRMIGGQDGAASRLGLPRTTLIYEMRKLGIETRRVQTRTSFCRQSARRYGPSVQDVRHAAGSSGGRHGFFRKQLFRAV